jgi:YVTN family beta-propeller protein
MIGRPTRRRFAGTAKAMAGAAFGLLALAAAEARAASFPGPTTSSPITLSRNEKLLFVANPRDNTVSVVCTTDRSILATIRVGKDPRSVAVDPDDAFLFVANAESGSVTVIRILDSSCAGWSATFDRTIRTGSEPWNIVASPDGRRIFVSNSGQDTVTVIDARTRDVVGQVDLRDSLCNEPDRDRHLQPRGLAVTENSRQLYVTRFLSFTTDKRSARQARDVGKEGAVCRLDIDTGSARIRDYRPAQLIALKATLSGFAVDSSGDGSPDPTRAFPNQLQSIVIRGDKAYLPNVAASPESPLVFNNSTQAFVNVIEGVGESLQSDGGAVNLHLGARDPEPGRKRLFFANPWAIGFTNQKGAGSAYVVSSGADVLVKLDVDRDGALDFTVDADTTRYVDLNDPEDSATAGANAGKNPLGIAVTRDGSRAFVANYVSGNVSIVNLGNDRVSQVFQTAALPVSGSRAEEILVGAEMFFSSRGHFNRPSGTSVSTDERLSAEGWQNCASCHFNGWTDGVVWSFGSGPRKSVNLAGSFNPQNRNQQKVLNYSAIFDEIEDFELNIRNVSGPGGVATPLPCSSAPPDVSAFDPNHGLLIGDDGDVNRAPCVINAFAKANAGRQEVTVDPVGATPAVKALTALKNWVKFAVRVPNGPLDSDEIDGGVPASDLREGRKLFRQQQCQSCHGGGLWSSSVKNFVSPPAGKEIACEVDLAAAAPPNSKCVKAPVFGDPVAVQFLSDFLRNVGSFNLGVRGEGNGIGGDIGAPEKAAATLVAGVSQPPKDGLGVDYNQDRRGLGFSPQSLLGVHAVQPYMHNGACESLACVVGDRRHRTGAGVLPDVLDTAAKRAAVVRFLESIDAETQPFD